MNFSEVRAEGIGNVLTDLLEERWQQFGDDGALNAYYMFLDYTSCIYEDNMMENRILQHIYIHAWIGTEVTCLTEWKKRGGNQKKLYADTYASYVTTATRQLENLVGSFLKAGNSDVLYMTSVTHNNDCVAHRYWDFWCEKHAQNESYIVLLRRAYS